MADRTSYHKTLKVYKTAEDAIEKITPFRGHDSLRVHSRKTTFSRLIVMSGFFIFDIEYALRKKMYDFQVAAVDCDPFNLPTFAGQETCPQFDPDGDEAMIDKRILVELIANTRLNQALSIHPTTDAFAQRVEDENGQILRDSTRDFLACYDDENSLIHLRRMESWNGIDYLTMDIGRRAQSLSPRPWRANMRPLWTAL